MGANQTPRRSLLRSRLAAECASALAHTGGTPEGPEGVRGTGGSPHAGGYPGLRLADLAAIRRQRHVDAGQQAARVLAQEHRQVGAAYLLLALNNEGGVERRKPERGGGCETRGAILPQHNHLHTYA